VRIGQDSYWISPDATDQWYALPAPYSLPGEVPLRVRFNHDYVAGYSAETDKGDRNLYISNVLLCRLR
jgi:hypothetical protein